MIDSATCGVKGLKERTVLMKVFTVVLAFFMVAMLYAHRRVFMAWIKHE